MTTSQKKNLPQRRYAALTIAITAALTSHAYASDLTNDLEILDDNRAAETIVVYGQAASLDASIERQRASDRIESVVRADGIGQLPDDNAAEALQRLPGVSIERDQGEGRFVRIRGLSPDLNAVTINGSLVPAPERERRAVALDVLPAELLQSVSISKTLTPDMDANSLGGTVAVESLSAFDHRDGFYSVSAEAGYDSNSAETSPKYGAAFSRRIGDGNRDYFGIAAAFSHHNRKFGSDNVETGGDWDFDDGAKLGEFELRDYQIERERIGAAVNLDFRPDDNSRYYLRTLYSRFGDQEIRHALVAEFADAMVDGEVGEVEVTRELKDREEIQTIQSYVLGLEKNSDQWTVSAQLGLGKADEDNQGEMNPAAFSTDEGSGSFSGTRTPRFNGDASFFVADNFELDEVELANSLTTDEEHNARLDITRRFNWGNHDASLKGGVKISRREKQADSDVWAYEDLADFGINEDDLLLSALTTGAVDYALGDFGPAINARAIRSLLRQLDHEEFFDDEASQIEDFTMKEDVDAAYLMHTVDLDDWRVIAGLRYESTTFSAEGVGVRDGEFETNVSKREDDFWLPGLHARYQWDDDTQVRLAISHSVVRPSFGERSPGFVIDGDEAEFGNPQLKPLQSRNIDFGIEHYMGAASMVSAFIFSKDIEHFIYQTDVAGSGDWVDFDEAITFVNGDDATVSGLELAWSQKFDNGFLLAANYTVTDAEATIANGQGDKRDIRLPNQSDVTGNLIVGYENSQFSFRVTMNYKSDYLLEVSDISDKQYDVWVEEQQQVDVSARWFIQKGLQVFVEARNLGDEPYYVYTGRRAFNHQYEEYGPSYSLGLSFSAF